MRMSAGTIASTLKGRVIGTEAVVVSGAEVDSRLVREGDLFIALPGARADGHDFVAKALETASAALVRIDCELDPPPEGKALITVGNPLEAYHQLATTVRRQSSWQVAALTGSVGKTTTKDFLTHLLKSSRPTGCTRGNRNSTLGLPAQILSQREPIDVFVAEAGMSSPGELDLLGGILRPDLLVYTRITAAHTEFFDSMEALAAAKAELIPHLRPGGTLVINADDPLQATFAERTTAAVLRYGRSDADARMEDIEDHGLAGTEATLVLPSGRARFSLPLPGRHQAENFLAAATAAFAFGLSADEIARRAEGLRAAPHRGSVVHLRAGVTLIDDSYNASPAAMERALSLLAASSGRRIAVLGEMFELGVAAATAHRTIGTHAAECCDLLLTVGGTLSAALADSAVAAGLPHFSVHRTADWSEAAETLQTLLNAGATVLVKGSRGVRLDRLVARLVEEQG